MLAPGRALHQPQLPAYMRQQPGKRLLKRKPGGLTKKIRAVCDLLVQEGYERAEACALVGISERSIKEAFRKPAVIRYLREQEQVLRDGERYRNIRAGMRLRDQADSERVQLEAAKWLHGEHNPSGSQVNVGVSVQVTPGYVLDLREDEAMLHADNEQRRLLIEQASMPAKPLKDK